MKGERKKVFLTVVIPCYNEAENLQRGVLGEVRDYVRRQKFSWEVVISDDGSTDESQKLVKRQIKGWRGFRLLLNSHGGKPSALWYGIKAARGEYVLFSDMDQSTPIGEVGKLLLWVKKGYEVVIGSRGLERKGFPLYRRMGARVFRTFRQFLILAGIGDTQCGFKLFKRNRVKEAFPKLEFFRVKQRTKGWKVTSFDVELLRILQKAGCKIREVVVEWQDRDVSKSKGGGLGKYVRESQEMLMQILRVKVNDMRGRYEIDN